jgi:16S rRNA processing protein RimM
MADSEVLRVGSITKPHGLKGAVKVYPTTDDKDNLSPGQQLFISVKDKDIPVTIKTSSRFKNLYILSFDEYSSIEEVEALRGADLFIRRSDVRELSEDEYFISDLIGLKTFDEDGSEIGVLKEVLQTGANDAYVISRPKQSDLLIPAIKECILSISTDEGRMTVRLMPGME